MEEDNLIQFDENVERLNEINIKKRKKTKGQKITFFDVLSSSFPLVKNDKGDVLNKCQELIDELMDIGYITNKLVEINYMKSMIFDERENMIFNYQKKRLINLSNPEGSEEYIESLMEFREDEKFKIKDYKEIDNKENDRKEKLLGYLSKFYI